MYLASTQCSVVELNCIGQVQVELRNRHESDWEQSRDGHPKRGTLAWELGEVVDTTFMHSNT